MFIINKGISPINNNAMDSQLLTFILNIILKEVKKKEFKTEILKPILKRLCMVFISLLNDLCFYQCIFYSRGGIFDFLL